MLIYVYWSVILIALPGIDCIIVCTTIESPARALILLRLLKARSTRRIRRIRLLLKKVSSVRKDEG